MSPCCSFPSRRNTRFCLLPLAPFPPKGNVWVRCRVCAREIEASVWLRSVRNMLFRRCLDLDRLSEESSGSSMISLWRARAGRSWLKDTVLARRDDCENNTITYYITKTTHVFRNPSIISLRNERAVLVWVLKGTLFFVLWLEACKCPLAVMPLYKEVLYLP